MSFECMNCPDRHVGCHISCESYLDEKAKIDKRNREIHKVKQEEHILCDYYREQRKRRKNK